MAARTEIESPAEIDRGFVVRYRLENLPARLPRDTWTAYATLFLGYAGDRGLTIELGRIDHPGGEGSFRIDPTLVAPRSVPEMIQSARLSLATHPSAIGNARAIYIDGERPWIGGVALGAGQMTLPKDDGEPGRLELGAIDMMPYPRVGSVRLVDPGEMARVPLRISIRRMAPRAAGIIEIGTAFEGRQVWMGRHEEELQVFAEGGVAAWTVAVMSSDGLELSRQEKPAGEDILISVE